MRRATTTAYANRCAALPGLTRRRELLYLRAVPHRGLTLPSIWPRPTRPQGEGHSSCYENIMADRYLEAVQCLNRIEPERFAEALETADTRAGLRSFQEGRDPALVEIVFSVPDEQFWWFRLVLRKMAEKYERHRSIVETYRKLNSPRS